MLDLVLSSLDVETVEVSGDVEPVVPADAYHPPLSVRVRSKCAVQPRGRMTRTLRYPSCGDDIGPTGWNFRKADFQSLYGELYATKWDDMLTLKDVDEAVTLLYSKLHHIFDKHVPKKSKIKQNSKYQYPVWFTPTIIKTLKDKYFHLKKFKQFKLEFNQELYKFYRQRAKELIDQTYDEYIQRTEADIKRDPKTFWNFVKGQQASRQTCTEFEYEGQTVAGADAANAFAKYFSSVFLPYDPVLSAANAELEATNPLCSSRIAIDVVDSADLSVAIRRLKAHSSAGPDGIPPFILKDCLEIFRKPLLFVYNLAIQTASYPAEWKISRVTPVPKGGTRSKVDNYRPIAVLSAFGKVFESILNRYITSQIKSQLAECQHGFRAGKSTVTNHINFVDFAVTEMDKNKQVDVAYFDFKKAFDRVQTDVLLKKLCAIGFTPKLLQLFSSYFTDRVQYVQIAGHKSVPYITCSGVSQGSTLGPTQFIVMANDLPTVVRTAKCLMFADDLKLFLGVNSEHDCEALQRDIDRVVEWSEANHLEFNSSKCKTISFTRSRTPIQHNYHISGIPLERVNEIKDLGLTLDVNMTFNQHIINICAKAFQSLGFVMRQASRFSDRNVILTLYYSFVRSKLEYNALVWDPHEQKYKLMIERVQRKFARYLYKKMYGYYPYLYPSLFVVGMVGINTLELRRKCALLMHYFLLLNNKIDDATTLARCSLFAPDRLRRSRACTSRCLFAAPPARTQTARYAPTNQALNLLNALIAQTPDVDIFVYSSKCMLNVCVKFFS